MSVLVISEHDSSRLSPSTLSVVNAACQLNTDVFLLVIGSDCHSVILQAREIDNVSSVLWCEQNDADLASIEDISLFIINLHYTYSFSHLMVAATSFGKDLMPRVSALLDVVQLSDIIEIISQDTYVRMIYSGNVLLTVKSIDPVKVITVCTSVFSDATGCNNTANVVQVTGLAISNHSTLIRDELNKSTKRDLSNAKCVIAVGKGIGGGENLANIENIANNIGATLGATRSAVEQGYLSNKFQIGQTGVKIAPELYLSLGVSGAIQHVAGISHSKKIVAVNIDENALIFQFADYGLIADINEVIPELTRAFVLND
ncbi:electron transfer flavoprotein subunit alpha/FixB family protein [Brenneria goodwinii]|uniref:electron transfer flavoprotein subunit alpha/FixB family protein n=1 Tax=Brenneria goodwinii TaxID=1109412 RepID=UPI0036E98A44